MTEQIYKIAVSKRSVYDRLGESCATTFNHGWEVLVTFTNLPDPAVLASVVRLIDADLESSGATSAPEYGLFRNETLIGLAEETYNMDTAYDCRYYHNGEWQLIGIATRHSETEGIGEATSLPIVDDTPLGLFDGPVQIYRTTQGQEWTLV